MNTKTQQLIIPVVLSLFLAAPAPLRADSKKGGGGSHANTFSATGSMNVPRYGHKMILLGNGQVLAVTGVPFYTNLDNTAELYNPATETWSLTGTTATYHEYGSATLLANGQVLLAGGDDPFDFSPPAVTATAELYSPATGQWSPTGSMPSARRYQSAVLLPNGEVLVVGGEDSSFGSTTAAFVYNPATGTWQTTASMHQSRALAPIVLLTNGTVLVAGGVDIGSGGTPSSSLTNAEIYNPSTAEWTVVADMPTFGGRAVLLQNGDALVARDGFYDPGTGTWTPTGPFPSSIGITQGPSTATVLTSGAVLLTGFRETIEHYSATLSETLLYNFSTNGYATGPAMTSPRIADTAILLPNGQVLVSGGEGPLSSAELYTP